MTHRVAIVTDSVACLTRELVAQYDIRIVPVNFYFEGRLYRDWVDITPDEAYKLFLRDPDAFKTSSSSPADWYQTCREAAAKSRGILCITLSAKLSGVHTSALEARGRLQSEFPGLRVEVWDSGVAAAAEGLVALAAARAAAAGASLEEVINAARTVKDRVYLVGLLDTLRHIYRSGRVPKIAAVTGSIIHIRPLLTISSGVVRFAGMVRSRERGIERMLKTMQKRIGQDPAHVVVMHAYAHDYAAELRERVAATFNCVELWTTEFSPVMGYATGTGTLGLAFYKED